MPKDGFRHEIRFVPFVHRGGDVEEIMAEFLLHGPKGTVEFGMLTGWRNKGREGAEPRPARIVIHARGRVPRSVPVGWCPVANHRWHSTAGYGCRHIEVTDALALEALVRTVLVNGDNHVWDQLAALYMGFVGPALTVHRLGVAAGELGELEDEPLEVDPDA
jgi:hypothetical protein